MYRIRELNKYVPSSSSSSPITIIIILLYYTCDEWLLPLFNTSLFSCHSCHTVTLSSETSDTSREELTPQFHAQQPACPLILHKTRQGRYYTTNMQYTVDTTLTLLLNDFDNIIYIYIYLSPRAAICPILIAFKFFRADLFRWMDSM